MSHCPFDANQIKTHLITFVQIVIYMVPTKGLINYIGFCDHAMLNKPLQRIKFHLKFFIRSLDCTSKSMYYLSLYSKNRKPSSKLFIWFYPQ